MQLFSRSRTTAVVAGAAVIALAAGSGAVASSLVTSQDIRNHTIQAVDINDGGVNSRVIKDGSVHSGDLVPSLSAGLARDKYVTAPSHKFSATNDSVSLTADGVEFGPYADGGSAGGSFRFNGMNGKTLNDIKSLVYYARYTATGDSGGVGVPYLRVFLNNDNNDAIFSPNTQSPDADTAEGPFHEWVATSGSWRYDDDGGNGPDESFQQLLADHGTDTISGIYVSTGFSNGQNLSALLRSLEVNGTTYHFGS